MRNLVILVTVEREREREPYFIQTDVKIDFGHESVEML